MKFFVFILLFVSPCTLLATDSLAVRGGIVRGIIVTGNEKTKEYIITREMSLKIGDTISQSAIEYDKNRIFSLRLFNRVDITPLPMDSTGVMLHVDVDERWYIFPYPILGIKDRDWSKIYYGAGILHDNFLGENRKIFVQFAVGYDPFVEMMYRNPQTDSAGNVFIMAHAYYSRVRNRSVIAERTAGEFTEGHYVVEGEIGRRFGITTAIWSMLSYAMIDVSAPAEGRTIAPGGIDRFLVLNVGANYDTRDLKEYPSMGTYAGAGIMKAGFWSRLDYWRVSADLRRFFPIGSFASIGFRGFTNVAMGGEVPLYDHVYFGYSERIRGHFRDVLEGESILGSSAELHVPILKPIFFTIPQVPIPQFATVRFGITAAVFADAGQVWSRGTAIALNQLTRGYGFGLHFLLPYSIILRTEVGFNEHAHSQFIFDLAAAF